MNTHYVPHLLYSVAIISTSIHLLSRRKEIESQRSRFSAQISILESLRQRLGSGEAIPDAEVSRLLKLAKAQEGRRDEQQGTEVIEWKTVFSRVKQDQHGGLNEWDRKDLAKIMKELEADSTSKGS